MILKVPSEKREERISFTVNLTRCGIRKFQRIIETIEFFPSTNITGSTFSTGMLLDLVGKICYKHDLACFDVQTFLTVW